MGKAKPKFYRAENKYDPYLLKDALQQYITDYLKDEVGVKEDYKFQNFKCILGFVIVANVIFSHFHFVPWPQDYYILAVCVVIYYVTTRIYTNYENKTEDEIFFLFDDKELVGKKLGFQVKMPLCTPNCSIKILDYPNKNILSYKDIQVNNYFDERGYICKNKMQHLITELLINARRKSKTL